MSNVKVPGVIWVVVLVLLLTVVRTAVDQYGVNPLYFDLAVVAVMAVLKAMNLGTKEIDELLAIIAELQQQAMSPKAVEPMQLPMTAAQRVERQPNKLVRWLVG